MVMQVTNAPPHDASRSVIAVDIGGTNTKFGLVSLSGEVLAADQIETLGPAGPEQLFARLLPCLRTYLSAAPLGVAVSTLGIVAPEHGRIVMAADAIADYCGESVVDHLAGLGLPIAVENDVNCVALAEGWVGATKGVRSYIALTLGTGIGGGIVIDNKLYRGHSQGAGEWGYMLIDGLIWEDFASLRGLAALARTQLGSNTWTARTVFEASDGGNTDAALVVDRWYRYLATGISNLIYAFNPEAVVIGGGITARGGRFLNELDAYLRRSLRAEFHATTRLCLATAGNHAGLLGATYNWLKR